MMAIKPGAVVTAPISNDLSEWSGQSGIIIEIKRKGELKGKIIVLVASAVDDLRASRFMFERENLTEGGAVADAVMTTAQHYIDMARRYEEDQTLIKRWSNIVDEFTEKMVRKGVKLGTTSETARLWIDHGYYHTAFYYTTYTYKGKEIARVPKNAGRFIYADYLKRVYAEYFGEGL